MIYSTRGVVECLIKHEAKPSALSDTRGGHYHRPRVTICDRDQNVLIRKNGFDHLIYLKNTA